jgi:hypothetical protein
MAQVASTERGGYSASACEMNSSSQVTPGYFGDVAQVTPKHAFIQFWGGAEDSTWNEFAALLLVRRPERGVGHVR